MIAGGVVGFLPIVGFWMIPLGLGVLSIDNPSARRLRRRFLAWAGRRWSGIRAIRRPSAAKK
ncbi:hypothetical protein NIM86_08270 [Notoacmeibacter sp. MSK16QG-6]|nr:hypothetical protein [Notoacmeibacter sp. MSK16QG-6]MCP1199404.1 hypothetical protein [Notoacmeibacter sp. MSK16QG-6]